MLRPILAVILTYITMAIIIMAAFAALWIGLGPNRLLEPGTWKGNMILSIGAPAITILAGLFGGWMCAKIGRGRKPVLALAAVVFVLGMIMCYFTLQKPEPTGARDPSMTAKQIMENGREPTWIAILNPIIGAAAVLVSGLLTINSRKSST